MVRDVKSIYIYIYVFTFDLGGIAARKYLLKRGCRVRDLSALPPIDLTLLR